MPGARRDVGRSSVAKPDTLETDVVVAPVFGEQAAACRTGWAVASKRLAASNNDAQVLPEIANEADMKLQW